MKDSAFERGQLSTGLFKNPYLRRYFKNLDKNNSTPTQVSPNKKYSTKDRSSPNVFSSAETPSNTSSKASVFKPDTKPRFLCKEIALAFSNEEYRPTPSYKSTPEQKTPRKYSKEEHEGLESTPELSFQPELIEIDKISRSDILIFDSKLTSLEKDNLRTDKITERASLEERWQYESGHSISVKDIKSEEHSEIHEYESYFQKSMDESKKYTHSIANSEQSEKTEHFNVFEQDIVDSTRQLENDLGKNQASPMNESFKSMLVNDEELEERSQSQPKPRKKTPSVSEHAVDPELEVLLDTLLDKHVLKGLRILGGFSEYLKKHS